MTQIGKCFTGLLKKMRCRVFSALANLQSRKALPSCAVLQQLMPSAIRLTHIWSVLHVRLSMPALSGHCCDLRLSYQRSTLQVHHCGKVLCKMPQLVRLHVKLHAMNTVRIASNIAQCAKHRSACQCSQIKFFPVSDQHKLCSPQLASRHLADSSIRVD